MQRLKVVLYFIVIAEIQDYVVGAKWTVRVIAIMIARAIHTPLEPLPCVIHTLHLLAPTGVREQVERAVWRQGDRYRCITIGHTAEVDQSVLVVHSRWHGAIDAVSVASILVIPEYGPRWHT